MPADYFDPYDEGPEPVYISMDIVFPEEFPDYGALIRQAKSESQEDYAAAMAILWAGCQDELDVAKLIKPLRKQLHDGTPIAQLYDCLLNRDDMAQLLRGSSYSLIRLVRQIYMNYESW